MKGNKDLWVAALRSGNYRQGKGRLVGIDDKLDVEYCALGVLCKVLGFREVHTCTTDPKISYFEASTSDGEELMFAGRIPVEVLEEHAPFLTYNASEVIADFNDFEKMTFEEIADYIEDL